MLTFFSFKSIFYKCKEKDLEGLVACSCEKGIFKKKYRKKGINKNE